MRGRGGTGIALARSLMTSTDANGSKCAAESERDLLARLVHDLKNPLSALLSFAEEIPAAEETDRADFCKRLVSNAHRAVQVLDEFALVSDLRSGRLEAHAGECDWGAVVSRGVADATVAASGAGERIASKTCAAEIADTDGLLLQRVVCGLLREVLRRTCEHERVTVEGRADAESLIVRVAVPQCCDCRPGGLHVDPGLLGVELARRVAALLGGVLECDSECGNAVVTLRVPRVLPASVAADHGSNGPALIREAVASA